MDIGKSKILREVQGIFILGYLLRLMVMFIDLYLNITVFSSGTDTERFFREMTYTVLINGFRSRHLYVRIIGKLFQIIGISRLFAQYINVLLSILSLYFVTCTLDLLQIERRNKRKTIFLMAVLPITLCLSSILLRESVITALLTLTVFLCIKWMKNGSVLFF